MVKTTQILFVAFVTLTLALSQKSADESRPYEFGFTVDGQQHRHEKKDVKGIIEGEFGFITADGVYHVTVYATDENGKFKILSMKNVRISAPLDGSPLRGELSPDAEKYRKKAGLPPLSQAGSPAQAAPNPLNIPQAAPEQKIATTPKSEAPFKFTTQPTLKPACASCGFITTQKPKPGQPGNGFQFQNPVFQKQDQQKQQSPHAQSGTQGPSSVPIPSGGIHNRFGDSDSTQPQGPPKGQSFGGQQQYPQNNSPQYQTATGPQNTNYNSVGGAVESQYPSTGNVNIPSTEVQAPYYSGEDAQAPNGQAQNDQYPSIGVQDSQYHSGGPTPQYPSGGNQDGKYPSGGVGGAQYSTGAAPNTHYSGGVVGSAQYPAGPQEAHYPSEDLGSAQYPGGAQNEEYPNGDFGGAQYPGVQNAQYPSGGVGAAQYPGQRENQGPQYSDYPKVGNNNNGFGGNGPSVGNGPAGSSDPSYEQDGPRPNPLQVTGQGPAEEVSNFPPVAVSNGVIHVGGDKKQDIPIRDKFPGMQEGLPDGIEEKDITGLLYKFHYTVGFHGHYEKGLKNGAKVGGYFVNGRDGISRVVTYVADENGYRPKVKFINLGLSSDETPKPETEKTFGLKSFEFVWYPVE